MNASLFQDLYRFVNTDITNKKIYEDEFFFYLIGYDPNAPLKSIDYDIFDDTEKYINGRKKLRDALGEAYSEMLERNKNLRLQDLFGEFLRSFPQEARQALENIPRRLDEIKGLYQTHEIHMPEGENAEGLLLHLFSVCVTESRKQLFASYKNQQLKPSTIKSILGREEDARKLKDDIDTYHKVIISAEYGSGKSYFVQYCLNQWKPQDYCYLFYETDLESTLRKIRYQNDSGIINTNETADRLMDKTLSSPLLIIDNMYFSENLPGELGQLSGYPIDIIVITTTNVKNDFFHPFKMSELPDETLGKIFENCSGLVLEDKNLLGRMLYLTQRNPLMISLLAKQCGKSAELKQNCKNQNDVIGKNLSLLETLDNHTESNDKFKHAYDKKTLDLIGHVKYVYQNIIKNINTHSHDTIKFLSCFGWSPIPISFISEVLPSYKKDDLKTLFDMGLLLLTEDSIQLTPLVSRAIFAAENPRTKDYTTLVENLIRFLEGYDKTLSVPYLSDTLFVFVDSLYKNVPFSNNGKKQKKTTKDFEKWQELLYLTVNYYQRCGAFFLARKLTAQLYFPDEIKNSHNFLDKDFFLLDDDMQQFNIDGISKKIDVLCDAISKDPNLFSNANVSFFLFDVMDRMIYYYCHTIIQINITRQCPMITYIPYYINIISKIWCCFNCKEQLEKSPLHTEKLSYYKLCYNLMATFPGMLGHNNLKNKRLQLMKWENIDYRIHGTSFILFMQSYASYFAFYFPEKMKGDFSLIAIFNDYIVPTISYLNKQIRCCKLISFHALYLCLLAYMNALTLQYMLLLQANSPEPPIPLEISKDTIKELLLRCTLPKKETDDIISQWDNAFSELLKFYQ